MMCASPTGVYKVMVFAFAKKGAGCSCTLNIAFAKNAFFSHF